MADRVADAGRTGKIRTALAPCVCAIVRHKLLPWAWMAHNHATLPSLDDMARGQYEKPDSPSPDDLAVILKDVECTDKVSAQPCQLKFLSANVCTLVGKVAAFKQQGSELGIHVMAFQETRCKGGHVPGKWITFQAGANKGFDGVALWFNSGVAWGPKTGSVPLCPEHLFVLVQEPTLLAVACQHPSCKAMFVSFRGPHSLCSSQQIKQWWAHLRSVLSPFLDQWPCVLLGDANAKIEHPRPPFVGDLGIGQQDIAGDLLTELAVQWDLCVMNTQHHVMRGVAAQTWKNSRLDYVLTPMGWGARGWASPGNSFDLLNAHEDHTAVIINCSVPPAGRTQCPPPRRTFRGLPSELYVEAMHQAARVEVPWGQNVHQHAELVLDRARRCLQEGAAYLPARPKKPHISAEALTLVQQKRTAVKQSAVANRKLHTVQRKFQLRRFFNRPRAEGPVRIARHVAAIWQHVVELANLNLRRQLRHDRVTYLTEIAAKIEQGVVSTNSQEVYQALRFFRPASKRVHKPWGPLPMLERPDGSMAETFCQAQEVKARYFGDLEAATPLVPEKIAGPAFASPCKDTFEIGEVPTLLDLEGGLRELPRRKAPGASGLPNEVWLAGTATAARIWMPVLLKCQVRLTEPLRFSTSLMATLYKGKGTVFDVANHRSIYLMEGVGKAIRKLHRPPLVQSLQSHKPGLMQGSTPHSASDQLTHYLITLALLAKQQGACCALLFVDARSAFYRVLRERLTGMPTSDEELCSILSQLGVSDGAFRGVMAWITGDSLMQGVPPHVRRVVASWFDSSCFVLRGLPQAFQSRAGTRPGDAMADILFAFVLRDAMVEISTTLEAAGLLESPATAPLQHPTWVDDVCLPVFSRTACGLTNRLSAVCAVMHDAYLRRGLAPNYSRGKTEAVIVWAGKGSTAAKQGVLKQGHQVRVVPQLDDPFALSVVPRYVHLGTVLSTAMNPKADFAVKLAHGIRAAAPVARKVLRNKAIPLKGRAEILSSIALSAATHNTGVWVPTDSALEKWTQGITSMYRMLLPEDRWGHHPDFPGPAELCGALLLPMPAALLVAERIRHFLRIVRDDNRFLWELLCMHAELSEDAWLRQVHKDLGFVAEWAPEILRPEVVKTARGSYEELLALATAKAPCVTRALKQAIGQHTAKLQQWATFQLRARKLGLRPPPQMPVGAKHPCWMCDQVFPSTSHLAAHIQTVHEYSQLARQYTGGCTTCRACLKNFWDSDRLLRHLARSNTGCLPFLLAVVPPMDPHEWVPDAGPATHWPPVRAAGPLRPFTQEDEASLYARLFELEQWEVQALMPSLEKFDAVAFDVANVLCDVRVSDRATVRCTDFLPNGTALIDSWLQT